MNKSVSIEATCTKQPRIEGSDPAYTLPVAFALKFSVDVHSLGQEKAAKAEGAWLEFLWTLRAIADDASTQTRPY